MPSWGGGGGNLGEGREGYCKLNFEWENSPHFSFIFMLINFVIFFEIYTLAPFQIKNLGNFGRNSHPTPKILQHINTSDLM